MSLVRRKEKLLLGLFGFLGFLRLKLFVLLAESLDTPRGIHQFLLSGVKRMALGTDFHADILLCGARGYFVATCASNDRLMVCGMDILFHGSSPPSQFLYPNRQPFIIIYQARVSRSKCIVQLGGNNHSSFGRCSRPDTWCRIRRPVCSNGHVPYPASSIS